MLYQAQARQASGVAPRGTEWAECGTLIEVTSRLLPSAGPELDLSV